MIWVLINKQRGSGSPGAGWPLRPREAFLKGKPRQQSTNVWWIRNLKKKARRERNFKMTEE